MKSRFYMTTDTLVVRLWISSRALPRAKLASKKVHGHWWSAARSDLQLSESQWNHYIWELCSANRWNALKTAMPAADIDQQKGPSSPRHSQPHVTQPMLQKLNELDYKVLSHSPYSPDLSPTDYHFFKHLKSFLQRKCFHIFSKKMLGGRKCFPRVHQIPKHGFLCYRNKQTSLSLAKMCCFYWFLFWLIKVFLSLVLMI